ncbi:branched-chain amino acid ABC transporter permease [Rhodosalinus halophilus]|uniref:Branched-chain amino acid ABC transporter permease n=1 Tax=Rhodosalinus halophilus TaxID=2259333 RepID=A0A365UB98_9RHOB|nr:AzlC family ABC transporter permease [Rhodosalinus halophilus]RBI85728.1 branched-chain amino acid ABC transporter permease [Rhodosalinus halophilus]
MAPSSPRHAFVQGARDALPFTFVVSPFALLFGVVATEAGLNVVETLAFSIAVLAGASQFAALQLLTENAPTVIVLASALAVNLRMAMYSASLTPHLGEAPLWHRALAAYFIVDQSYALSIIKYERERLTLTERLAYFWGSVAPVCPMWYVMTLVGALAGTAIPESVPLDFAVPITFIALITPMLRTLAHVVAAVVSVALALGFAFLPYNLGLMVAGVGAMMAGAQTEVWMNRRRGAAQ